MCRCQYFQLRLVSFKSPQPISNWSSSYICRTGYVVRTINWKEFPIFDSLLPSCSCLRLSLCGLIYSRYTAFCNISPLYCPSHPIVAKIRICWPTFTVDSYSRKPIRLFLVFLVTKWIHDLRWSWIFHPCSSASYHSFKICSHNNCDAAVEQYLSAQCQFHLSNFSRMWILHFSMQYVTQYTYWLLFCQCLSSTIIYLLHMFSTYMYHNICYIVSVHRLLLCWRWRPLSTIWSRQESS